MSNFANATAASLTPTDLIALQVEHEWDRGHVDLTAAQYDAFFEWFEGQDIWHKEAVEAPSYDAEYFMRHMENEGLEGEFDSFFDEYAILSEVRTFIVFYTDENFTCSMDEAMRIRRTDIDGDRFDEIIEKHRY